MTDKRLKIVYITSLDARDKRSWSGTYYFIAKALQKHVGDVDFISPVQPFFALLIGKFITGVSQKIFHKRYNYRHSYLLAKAYVAIVHKRLKKNKYDLIVIAGGSTFIPYLKTSIPIAYISDSTVKNTLEYYPALSNLWKFSEKETISIEQKALSKSSLLIYSSGWASNSAIHDFHISREKVFTIPFGANIEQAPNKEKIAGRKISDTCRLLFLGVDWNRKGGNIAFDAFVQLNDMGIDAELTVCGCIPPKKFTHPKLTVIPFLDKNNAEQKEKLDDLFFYTDFLILPTRKECFGIVFCEASAFGVPSITTDTGGVSSAVTEGKNGFLLPVYATGREYAQVIAETFKNKEKYHSLSRQSRELYDLSLNWDAWGESFKEAYSRLK